MKIDIAMRLRPLSHIPGTACLIPGTACKVEIFPTLLRFPHQDVEIPLKGPVKGFTIELDLERRRVRVFGQAADAPFSYFLQRVEQHIEIRFEKGIAQEMKQLPLEEENGPLLYTQERLSLGMHKTLDWELVKRRQDMKEILPVWLRLGQDMAERSFSFPSSSGNLGNFELLSACQEKIDTREKEAILPSFLNLFNAAFFGIMAPRIVDDQYQGISSHSTPSLEDLDPTLLLKHGSDLIRSLFFYESDGAVSFLRCLPPELHCGRFTHIASSNGVIDLEWSKKLLRRVVWRSERQESVTPSFQKAIRRFRLRRSLKDKGVVVVVGTPFDLEPDAILYLDRFEK
jgi:hypothetical protein